MYLTICLYEEDYYLKLGLSQNVADRCNPSIYFLNFMERRNDKFLLIKRSYNENWLSLAPLTYTAS